MGLRGKNNRFEHWRGKAARLRVVATAVKTVKEGYWTPMGLKLMSSGMGERMGGRSQTQCHQHCVVRDAAQRQNCLGTAHDDLFRQISVAAPDLGRQRFIARWQAFDGVGDTAVEQAQAVSGFRGTRVACITEFVQCRVEQNAGVITGEGPAGAIRPM